MYVATSYTQDAHIKLAEYQNYTFNNIFAMSPQSNSPPSEPLAGGSLRAGKFSCILLVA
jgi:hypothetical protein